ncbi:hypothetical protein Afil01_44140 [Actinorhabdospora filicis]|uniref:Peptide deformylase n=1 Tax=Actinorhabdospora filicis TaxID=1785913 RepID=A0A9W6SPP9_9ACTN|nr:hypothetical protein Afil01_44140 [Actinorhabdospora filicis]
MLGYTCPTAIQRTEAGGRSVFTWATTSPELHDRYKLEWNFRDMSAEPATPSRPSETMAALGIVQAGENILRRTARPFRLPEEADHARRVIDDLIASCERVARAHTFGKGMGIAAPQIGIDRAAAIAYTPGAPGPIVLLNPRITETAGDIDQQYEGCLSFFDVRCHIPRPRTIHVEHTTPDGTQTITIFHDGIARLVAHEVDHLHGILCSDHLPAGVAPTPIEEYCGIGSAWDYKA